MKSGISAKIVRFGTILIFFLLVVVGLVTNLAIGTLSSFGFGSIALICPLGALETMIASQTLIPLALISLLCVVIISVILGKVFCSWVCPVPLLRPPSSKQDDKKPSGMPKMTEQSSTLLPPSEFHPNKFVKPRIDSRFLVLLGVLVTTAAFGFPVFCLICPVGLTFATIIGIWRLIAFNEPSWLLFVFPAVLILELVVFKKWCYRICPLGAIFSLVSSLNKLFRPKVDVSKCLRTSQNIECTRCKDVCFEQINLHNMKESRPLSECTKCRDCAANCPVQAISFSRKAER
jgi:ferredoxin-type protein NapH